MKKLLEADEVHLKVEQDGYQSFADVDWVRLRSSGFVRVFDPNADNAFLMDGNKESADAM